MLLEVFRLGRESIIETSKLFMEKAQGILMVSVSFGFERPRI